MSRYPARREGGTTRRDLALLDGLFDDRTVQRGLALHHDDRVLHLAYDPTESAIEARVQGSRRTPYAVAVLLGDEGEVRDSLCSCPVGVDCKHAVAAFLAHRAGGEDDPAARPGPGGRPDRGPLDAATEPAAESVARYRLDYWLRRFEGIGTIKGLLPRTRSSVVAR